MLADSKAQAFVADFIEDWLDVNVLSSRPKDPMLYAMWNQDLANAMQTEFRSFGTTAVLGTGLFADLLTGNKSSVNQALAAVYGVSGVTGTTPKAVTFDASQRAGILTLAGFLTVTGASDGSSPVRRGHAVYTRLLCGTLPDPPGNVPPPKPPTPGLTTRQRFEMHDMNACTGACHAAMDPIGYRVRALRRHRRASGPPTRTCPSTRAARSRSTARSRRSPTRPRWRSCSPRAPRPRPASPSR